MVLELYPRVHRRYTSLAILGPVLDGYGTWLLEQGYSTERVREHFCAARRLVHRLQQRGVEALPSLTRARLRACAPADSQEDPNLAVLVRQLERYCESELALYPAPALTRIEQRVAAYRTYLQQVRGFAPGTVAHHGRTAGEFLAHINYETHPTQLAALDGQDLDAFLRAVGPRQSRASLQHVVGHLRAFLRFLASAGEIPTGLDTQIDTPRVYRGEKLPRALPWETVRAFLQTIDRTSPLGRRDYAIFLLIATYGLRACEVVTLTIDDVEWRAERLRIAQRKTRGSLWLPLTDEVGTALLDYLRHERSADNEIVQLLAVARTLARTSNSPLCPENMRLAIVLLSTTGLRRGELTRLTVGDYDPPQRMLAIRQSKFHKSRLVPLSADTAREVEHLIEIRVRRRLPTEADSPLIWHRSPDTGGYSRGGLSRAMRALFRRAGIRTATGHLPRTHDFRHGFAVNALLRWYRAGLDVQAKLPFLAAYMGHVSIVSTAYYLQFVEPLATAASAQFANHCGDLVTGPTVGGGAR